MGETLYIIDGHSQIYRAYYAPFRDLTSPTGEPTRATYVFCSMLLRLVGERRPNYLAMALDGPVEQLRRRRIYGRYKATRPPMPEDMLPQVQRIYQIVEAMGIRILRAEGFEADDIMATAAKRFAAEGMDVVLISRDKDLDQLVGPHVTLLDPMKEEVLDAAEIERQKGYRPSQAVEVQALCGDSTDNIPGVPGVGPKTAAKLIAKYGSAEAVIEHADELTPKLRQNVQAHAEDVRLARRLVALEADVPMQLAIEDVRFGGIPGERVRPIFAELGFTRLLKQLDDLAAGVPKGRRMRGGDNSVDVEKVAAAAGRGTAADFDYTCVNSADALRSLAKRLARAKRIGIDTEATSVRPMSARLVGLSVAWEPGRAAYVPVRAPMGQQAMDTRAVQEALGAILSDESVEKVGQNLKYDLLVLGGAGFDVRGPMFDTMIAAHVLDSTRSTYKLDALAADFLNHQCIPIEEVIGRGRNQVTIDCVPVETVATYAAEDADVALRLADVLTGRLRAEGLLDLLTELEMPLMPVLARMERTGIAVDAQVLKVMESRLSAEADALRDRIVAAAGRPFNPDSPKQLSEVLFDQMHLPVLKKTKTGPSTDSSVLDQLAVQHELPALVLDYRKLTKLIGTYLKALAECIHPQTHRVHTSFHQAGTATGRLSSSDPNLQNIPIRTEQGRQIRSAFVADEGNVLLSADYSQVELRVLAHLCKDPTLIQAFQHDQDIHRIVASEVFAVPLDQVSAEMRSRAKGVNFGIIYGQTPFGLSRALRIGQEEAADFIRTYRQRFPRIDEFLQACIAKAKSDGYVETIFGRRRRIAHIHSANPQRRAMAERLAINSVVQGSAADLIKKAMVNIDARIRREGRAARMLLQIHDELLFELPASSVAPDGEMIVAEMAGAIELRVPVKVDVGVGANWMEAK
jgi:DNA polymerase-1